jgi:hypothetical protein
MTGSGAAGAWERTGTEAQKRNVDRKITTQLAEKSNFLLCDLVAGIFMGDVSSLSISMGR